MIEKEILKDFKEKYGKVRILLDEESKNDPESLPFLSKYTAKEILLGMRESLLNFRNTKYNIYPIKLDAMLGTVLVNIGIINMETEELTESEKVLMAAQELLAPNSTKPEIVITLLNVYNNLGILWSNRDQPAKAKNFLLEAKELYGSFKCTLQMPLPIEYEFSGTEEDPLDEVKLLEKAHTLTLYYLAQIYGSLNEIMKSAYFCHVTLKRQLQYNDYDPIDWALNAATLSQFFAENTGFYQSRHHLAAASSMLEQYENELQSSPSDDEVFLAKVETLKHRSADVARCWAKYCILLLSSSKDRLLDATDSDGLPEAITDMSNLKLEDDENICDVKTLVFPERFDFNKYEKQIVDKYLLTYQDAREVFLCCQTWLNKAKEYYTLDTLASDYIELVQDSSQSFSYLAFFEEDDERRAKMHKRRINMLEELVKQVNPTYYLQFCKQLWYELGEVYSDIVNIKLDKLQTTKPEPHLLKKINFLCEKSIENFDHFLSAVKNKNGEFPEKLENDVIRPVVLALAYSGRNSMKRVAVDKVALLAFLKKSFDLYQAVVNICGKDEEAANMMAEEYSLCKEMVNILPFKIKRLENENRALQNNC